jgi:hypothetical protein
MTATLQPFFVSNVGTAVSNIFTAPAGGSTILRAHLTNKTAAAVNADIQYLNPDNGTNVYLIKGVFIPPGYTFEVQPAQPLKAGGILKISSSDDNSLDVTGCVTPLTAAMPFSPLMVKGLGMATTDIYTAPAGGAALLRLYLANTTAAAITATVTYYDTSASLSVIQIKDVLVPSGNTFVLEPIQALDVGDILRVSASADDSLDLTGCIKT